MFAVKEKNLRNVTKKKSFPADSTSSDSDSSSQPKSKVLKLERSDIGKDIKEMKLSLSSLCKVQKTMNIPLPLRLLLLDHFKCNICQDIIRPPAIFSRCCKYIIGCEVCVDSWYEGEGGRSKTCPRCRAERAYIETCRINGIDEFLTSIKSVLDNTSVN